MNGINKKRNRVLSTLQSINGFRLQFQSFVFKPIMNVLDNRPEDKYKQKWVDPLFSDFLLFLFSVLIVLQTFLILYRISQIISSFLKSYVCPLVVVKETDLDQIEDNKVDDYYSFQIFYVIIE